MDKPITLRREEYMQSLCDVSNKAGLPAFVMLEVVERLKSRLEQMVRAEYERDVMAYQSSQGDDNSEVDEPQPPEHKMTITGKTRIEKKEETKDADECV